MLESSWFHSSDNVPTIREEGEISRPRLSVYRSASFKPPVAHKVASRTNDCLLQIICCTSFEGWLRSPCISKSKSCAICEEVKDRYKETLGLTHSTQVKCPCRDTAFSLYWQKKIFFVTVSGISISLSFFQSYYSLPLSSSPTLTLYLTQNPSFLLSLSHILKFLWLSSTNSTLTLTLSVIFLLTPSHSFFLSRSPNISLTLTLYLSLVCTLSISLSMSLSSSHSNTKQNSNSTGSIPECITQSLQYIALVSLSSWTLCSHPVYCYCCRRYRTNFFIALFLPVCLSLPLFLSISFSHSLLVFLSPPPPPSGECVYVWTRERRPETDKEYEWEWVSENKESESERKLERVRLRTSDRVRLYGSENEREWYMIKERVQRVQTVRVRVSAYRVRVSEWE